MKHFSFLLGFCLAACSKTTPAPPPPPDASPAPTRVLGTITGKIVFEGPPPEMPELNRFSASGKPRDPACASHEKADYVVVSGGGVKDTVVRVAVGSFPAGAAGPPPERAPVIDQKNCLYSPHVVGVMVGQRLGFKSSDPTLHNVHTYVGDEGDFNDAFPAGSTAVKLTDVSAPAGDQEYRVRCDVHPWMEAHVVVSDHPFFTVSADDGSFKLQAPPGKYRLEAWHPHLGIKTADVTVEAGKTVEVKFPAYIPADYKPPA